LKSTVSWHDVGCVEIISSMFRAYNPTAGAPWPGGGCRRRLPRSRRSIPKTSVGKLDNMELRRRLAADVLFVEYVVKGPAVRLPSWGDRG
jgi:hypothetical protein